MHTVHSLDLNSDGTCEPLDNILLILNKHTRKECVFPPGSLVGQNRKVVHKLYYTVKKLISYVHFVMVISHLAQFSWALGPQTSGSMAIGPQTLGPQTLGPQSLSPQSLGPPALDEKASRVGLEFAQL